jgi:phosphatidate cytidylyltransferase
MLSETVLILAAIVAVLALATLIGFVLQVSCRGVSAASTVENLQRRIKSWWMITLVLGCAVLIGPWAVVLLFALISFVSLREFLSLADIKAVDRRAVVAGFIVVLPVQYTLIGMGRDDWFASVLPFIGLLLVPALLTVLSGDVHNYLARTSEIIFGLVVCVFCISYVPGLLTLDIASYHGRQLLLIFFLILVAQANDVLQYTCGKLLGRHNIAPKISPGKTIEGFLGGLVGATALGAGLSWITPFTVTQASLMAFLIALTGFLGGLTLSAIKRDRGVKDWSHLIPGHGGMLDRVDSLCFSAPVFFLLTRSMFAA